MGPSARLVLLAAAGGVFNRAPRLPCRDKEFTLSVNS